MALVRLSYTLYSLPIITRTPYSCQVMAPVTSREADRVRLSRAAVVERALALSDADGLEAVTIRRLATELGVSPMALYWHFRTKDELLAALADRVWAELDIHVDPAAPWAAQLRGLLQSLVRVLRQHPSASTLLLANEKMTGEAALAATEVTLNVLHHAGFDAAKSAAIARHGLFAALMLVMSEPGRAPGMTEAECAEANRRAKVRLALLPPDRYPHVIESAGHLTSCEDPDEHYEFGIDLLIAGVESIAAAGPEPQP